MNSNHERIQKAIRLGFLAFASLVTCFVAGCAAPPAAHLVARNEPIKKGAYVRSSDYADRAGQSGGMPHFNLIDGQPIR